MRKASAAFILGLLVFFGGTLLLQAQDHTGIIRGRIADKSGKALSGATVYLSSPDMQGSRIILTEKYGRFDFAALAAGIYTLTVEMPGFQTLVRDGIDLRTGMAFFFEFEPAPSESETDVPVPGRPPLLDGLSAKTAVVTDQAQVQRIPLARDFRALLSMAPGAVAAGYSFDPNPSVLGGTVRDNVYVLDGADLTDMSTSAPLAHFNANLTDEIEFITAAQPSSQLPAGGAYVNVISKSGGNSSAGELSFFLMNDSLNKNLWTYSQITSRGLTTPAGDKNYAEPVFSLGGPIMADRIWYFMTGRYVWKSLAGDFIGPYRDLLSQVHNPYDWKSLESSAFLKFTVRPVANAKASIWASLAGVYQPVAEDPSPRLPYVSTHEMNRDTSMALYGVLDYDLNPNTQTYFRAAYISRNIPSLMRPEMIGSPWIDDAADLYGPLTGADYNSVDNRQRLQAEGSIRLIMDNFLGTSHAFSAGLDIDNSNSKLDWWKQNNMLWYLDSRNPNSNFYPDRGLLGFWLSGSVENSTLFSAETMRLGVYVKDSFSVAKRLTFTLGLRFERDWSSLPAAVKYLSGYDLSLFIGDSVVSPRLAAAYPALFSSGYNPFDQITFAGQNSIISWNALSPRAGVAFDVWGTGKTILKAGYSRYADVLSQRYVLPLHPMYPQSLSVYWQDANGNGVPDVEDEFTLPNMDYRSLSSSYYPNRVAADIKAPTTEEISFSLDQELFKDFTLGFRFLSKKQTNILEDVLYAPDTGEYWYAPDQAAVKKYWIPFTTTVPGTDAYPNETVTIYTKSLQAPAVFLQLRNVPELERKYRAFEFVFQKRMSQGWQMAGSLVLSKAEGNIGGFAEDTTAFTSAANSPNYFINQYGRLDTDRPVQIKLMGAVELPFRFGLSAFFHYQSGRPWARWTQILPPADWCAAHNVERVYYTVNLEAAGSRRDTAWSSLDLRLEKDFSMGASSKLGIYADITNVLGFTASAVGLNDVYSWEPNAEGAGQSGRKLLQPDYGVTNALYGQRTVRLGFRWLF